MKRRALLVSFGCLHVKSHSQIVIEKLTATPIVGGETILTTLELHHHKNKLGTIMVRILSDDSRERLGLVSHDFRSEKKLQGSRSGERITAAAFGRRHKSIDGRVAFAAIDMKVGWVLYGGTVDAEGRTKIDWRLGLPDVDYNVYEVLASPTRIVVCGQSADKRPAVWIVTQAQSATRRKVQRYEFAGAPIGVAASITKVGEDKVLIAWVSDPGTTANAVHLMELDTASLKVGRQRIIHGSTAPQLFADGGRLWLTLLDAQSSVVLRALDDNLNDVFATKLWNRTLSAFTELALAANKSSLIVVGNNASVLTVARVAIDGRLQSVDQDRSGASSLGDIKYVANTYKDGFRVDWVDREKQNRTAFVH